MDLEPAVELIELYGVDDHPKVGKVPYPYFLEYDQIKEKDL